MNTITYHKAGIDDVKSIVDNRILFALELSEKQEESAVQALRENMLRYFAKATSENTCISFIARCDNEVAGIGSVHLREMPGNFKNPSGKWGYIMNMYTVPNHRRKGICKGILNHLVEEGKKMGITAFELHATKAGEMVYKQNGFSIHNEPTYRLFVK